VPELVPPVLEPGDMVEPLVEPLFIVVPEGFVPIVPADDPLVPEPVVDPVLPDMPEPPDMPVELPLEAPPLAAPPEEPPPLPPPDWAKASVELRAKAEANTIVVIFKVFSLSCLEHQENTLRC
jgi:hypothetical protein